MKRVLALLIAIVLCAVAFLPVSAPAQGRSQEFKGKFRKSERAIADHYIVVLKEDLPDGDVASKAAAQDVASVAVDLAGFHGGFPRHVYQHALKGFSVQLTEEAAVALSQDPRVEYVEEDGEASVATTQYNPTWGLDRIDQRDPTPYWAYQYAAYNYSNTGAGVNVYVIDSGILITHQEFGGRASIAADFINDEFNLYDCNGHGTHVAGTIGGATYGVAKSVNLRAVRVFGCGGTTTTSTVIAGIDWVTANRVRPAVANMSIGNGASDAMDAAVRRLIASGVTCVIAAGNDNQDAINRSPARVTEAITVGATDKYDRRALVADASGALAWGSNYGSVVDLFAPGVSITSAWYTSNTATATIGGTSMATPHVAGVAAQYLQTNPGASPYAVQNVIKSNATTGKLSGIPTGTANRLLYSYFNMLTWQVLTR